MKIDSETIRQLLSSMEQYNFQAFQFTNSVARALKVVSLVILAILMYLEMTETFRKLSSEQGQSGTELYISIGWKYLVAFSFVMLSTQIIDACLYISNASGNLLFQINTANIDFSQKIPEITGKVNWYQKMILGGMQAVSAFCLWGASITVKTLNFLRFVSLYLSRAVSCLIVASYVSETYKSVAVAFVKQFLAVMLQGILLIVVLRLYPIIASADLFEVASSGDFMKNLGIYFLFGVKNVLFIVTLIGTQTIARKMMGVL